MFGKNKIMPPNFGDGNVLEVTHIFATLQGEGQNAGTPAVFIRLSGCNLACEFCDTDFDTANTMALTEIMEQVSSLAKNAIGERVRNLVVITGGEPLRQNIVKLCEELLAVSFKVQLETNGTLYRELPAGVEIVCSPKLAASGNYLPLRPDLLARVSALKFIVSANKAGYGAIPDWVAEVKNIPVFVQPMDEGERSKNAANTQHAIYLAMQYGYRLSLQTHKILGIE